MSSEQGTCEPSAQRYTEIPFEKAEELWHLGVAVNFEWQEGCWVQAAPKDSHTKEFWAGLPPCPYKFRVQTE